MGFHKPVFGQAILGGTVHRVLTGSDSDVAILVDRGLAEVQRVLCPYMGGHMSKLAIDLAGRIARNAKAQLTVLHVVKPDRSADEETLHARNVVEKAFADPSQPTPVMFQVIHDHSPVDAVITRAQNMI